MVTTKSQSNVLRYDIVGSRRFSNYGFAVIVAIGALGFLLAGLSSFLKINLLPFTEPLSLNFVPQGLALSFYGVAGTLLEIYLLYVIAVDYGSGYNEFDRNSGKVTIFRRGRSQSKNLPATQLLKKLLCSTTIKQKTPIAMNLLLLNRQEFKPLVFHL